MRLVFDAAHASPAGGEHAMNVSADHQSERSPLAGDRFAEPAHSAYSPAPHDATRADGWPQQPAAVEYSRS